jgi:predicted MFS family arabinose efflux permease
MNTAPPALRRPTLRLLDYYIIEGLSAFAATFFLFGIYFWARARFGFSNTELLVLGAVQGLSHIVAARVGGQLGDRWGYNRLLVTGLMVCAATGLMGWRPDVRGLPYLATLVYAAFIGMTWPALEAGAMHLPGRLNMPQRLGIYNVVWSFSGAIAFALCGFLFAWDIHAVFWFPGAIHVLQLLWIAYHRGRHVIGGATAMSFAHVGDHQSAAVKKQLTRLSWLSNSVGYFLAGGFSALAPHLGEKLGLSQSWTIWMVCLLLVARGLGFILFWRWESWHYHRGWGLAALWTAPLLLALIFFINHIVVAAIACLLLGMSFGLSYYMSIYYSLDAGDDKGAQGGYHEAIIGLGILLGPLVGAVGGFVTGSTLGAKTTIIAGALAINALGLWWLRRMDERR